MRYLLHVKVILREAHSHRVTWLLVFPNARWRLLVSSEYRAPNSVNICLESLVGESQAELELFLT